MNLFFVPTSRKKMNEHFCRQQCSASRGHGVHALGQVSVYQHLLLRPPDHNPLLCCSMPVLRSISQIQLQSRGPSAYAHGQVSVYSYLSLWPQDHNPVLHLRSARYHCSYFDMVAREKLRSRLLGSYWGLTSCRSHCTFWVSRNTNPVDAAASFLISYRRWPATRIEWFWYLEWEMQQKWRPQ